MCARAHLVEARGDLLGLHRDDAEGAVRVLQVLLARRAPLGGARRGDGVHAAAGGARVGAAVVVHLAVGHRRAGPVLGAQRAAEEARVRFSNSRGMRLENGAYCAALEIAAKRCMYGRRGSTDVSRRPIVSRRRFPQAVAFGSPSTTAARSDRRPQQPPRAAPEFGELALGAGRRRAAVDAACADAGRARLVDVEAVLGGRARRDAQDAHVVDVADGLRRARHQEHRPPAIGTRHVQLSE